MAPRVVGIGGSVDAESQSGAVLRAVLDSCAARGASVTAFAGRDLDLPPYYTGAAVPAAAEDYLRAVRHADAVVISSPAYHGTVSGMVKNALDYLEELHHDQRPYLDGRPVGLVAVGRGWQAAVNTLGTLRQITHALRGWPTPYGVTVNSEVTRITHDAPSDARFTASIDLLASQLLAFQGHTGTGTGSGLPGEAPAVQAE